MLIRREKKVNNNKINKGVSEATDYVFIYLSYAIPSPLRLYTLDYLTRPRRINVFGGIGGSFRP